MFGESTLVPLGLFAMIAFIIVGMTKIISDGRIRRRLIETGATPELAKAIAGTPQNDPDLYGTLKWGLVTGAGRARPTADCGLRTKSRSGRPHRAARSTHRH
jgi:hypothetical protein